MRSFKTWLFAALMIAAVGGGVMVVETVSPRSALAQPAGVVDDHWRFHDGRWSHWNQADRRWYYTDGSHWYYHNGKAWAPYHFDKTFGRKGFERGAYKPHGENVKIVLPDHQIYIAP